MKKKTPIRNNREEAETGASGLVLPFEDAQALTSEPLHGAEEIKLHGKMAILPGDLQLPEKTVCQLLDAKLFYYLPAAEGILLAYRDLKITCRLAATFGDRPFAHIVYAAKAVVFRPRVGQRLMGVVSQLSSIKRHITCVLCNVLNVTILQDDQQETGKNYHSSPFPTFRIGDVICFELTSFTISPNGTVSIFGRKCDVNELTSSLQIKPKALNKTPIIQPVFSSTAVKAGTTPQQTPTWLKPTQPLQKQSAQRICFDSSDSSSDSSSEGSDSEGGSLSEDLDDNPAPNTKTKTPPVSSPSKEKRKHLGIDTQNSCTTPTHSLRKVPSANSKLENDDDLEDDCGAAKLEPMTPSSRGDVFDHSKQGSIQRHLHQQQQERQKSAKKRKYLAE